MADTVDHKSASLLLPREGQGEGFEGFG